MSSVAAYGDGLNHHEGDALAPDDHPDPYVRNKAMSERVLFRLHQRNGFPVVTLRPPFIYGPGNPFYREAFFWDRLRDKRPIIMPGDGRRLMQFVYVKDLVWACLRAMEEPAAVGHAFNIANLRPVTQTEAVEALRGGGGEEARNWCACRGSASCERADIPWARSCTSATISICRPSRRWSARRSGCWVSSPPTSREGLKETYRWYLRHHNHASLDYSFEDRLLGMAAAAAASS